MKQLPMQRVARRNARFRYQLHDTSGRLLRVLCTDVALRPGMIVDARIDPSPREVAAVVGIAATVRPVASHPQTSSAKKGGRDAH